MKMKTWLVGMIVVMDAAAYSAEIGTAFSYQGHLENGSGPVTDVCDFRFGLWRDPGSVLPADQVGTSQTINAVEVAGGAFGVILDFGAGAIDGDARWLEVEVQCPDDGSFVLLSPRVALTPVPHAIRAVEGVGPPNALEIDPVNGRVGIGTSTPQYPLHVVGAVHAQEPGSSPSGSGVRLSAPQSDPGISLQRGNGAGGVSQQWDIAVEHTDFLEIRDGTLGVDRMVISDTGLVGIGTTTPTDLLTVEGAIRSTTGGFKFPDGTTQTTAATDGNSLDEAYDQGGAGLGRIITADAGPVEIQGDDGLIVTGSIQSGNSIVIDGTDYTVTSDSGLELHLGSGRALRMEPNGASPILIGGYSGNVVTSGASGATIGGGGSSANLNLVTDAYGTVGGGRGNQAGDGAGSVGDRALATVGGGSGNTASGSSSTVSGGQTNTASGSFSTVGGGANNTAGGLNSTVDGGTSNSASGTHAAIGGGANSTASGTYSTVGGGNSNVASGLRSTVPGGGSNTAGGDYSLAAGNRAKVRTGGQVGGGDTDGDQGTFAWADSTNADFTSTGPDQFLIRASGGVGINTNAPTEALDVTGNMHASGTITSGNSITIDGTDGNERIVSSDALEVHTSTGRILRLEPETIDLTESYIAPNVIAGYQENSVTTGVVGATVAGGGGVTLFPSLVANVVTDDFGTIGGGNDNQAGDAAGTFRDAYGATVAGGANNKATGLGCTVSGGNLNTASNASSTIAGGWQNRASGQGAAVGGGYYNWSTGDYAVVVGGFSNVADSISSSVGGGEDNSAGDDYATVSGGILNKANGYGSTIGGGILNEIFVSAATISGGAANKATGSNAVIGGGNDNEAGDGSTVGGGQFNIADGVSSTIPGGANNGAAGDYSFAAGKRAKANHQGSFVWGDSTSADVASSANDQFTARAVGGVRFFTNTALSAGVILAAGGGSWSSISDRNVKRNVKPVDPGEILHQLTQVPLATWNYESQDESIRHIGPMAQDFHAAFAVGEDQRYITGIDADGVALAAIQGLHSLVTEKDCQIQSLDTEISNLKYEIDELRSLVKALADRQYKGVQE